MMNSERGHGDAAVTVLPQCIGRRLNVKMHTAEFDPVHTALVERFNDFCRFSVGMETPALNSQF